MADLLVAQEDYLSAGVHIGTKTKTGSMREYIYKARSDGLHVLDLKKMNDKISAAASFLAKYKPQDVYVVGSKDNAYNPIQKFCEVLGTNALNGRFTPGRFTNPSRLDFCEPKLVVVVDPAIDKQAVKEAFNINVPVIALCDTNNIGKGVDIIIPINNKGRKSIALVFWAIAREVSRLKGEISKKEDFAVQLKDFE